MRYSNRSNRIPKLVLKDANIIFSNFAGKETKFTPEGKRSFTVEIPNPEVVDQMKGDGWNIRVLPAREGYDEDDRYVIDVNVSYKVAAPIVELISSKGVTEIGEDEIKMLDWAEVDKIDLVINPYKYDFGGRTGIKGYLDHMQVWLTEDGLDRVGDPEDEPMPF